MTATLTIDGETLSVEVLRLQPGDVVAVSTTRDLEHSTAQRIRHYVGEVFQGHKVIVLHGDLTLRIVREDV